MTYPVINSRRMPYDIDGTVVGFKRADQRGDLTTLVLNQGVGQWLTLQQLSILNGTTQANTLNHTTYPHGYWFFFPETREIEFMSFLYESFPTYVISNSLLLQGSNDSTNGVDGTWETAIYTAPQHSSRVDWWRQLIIAVSFSTPYKIIRIAADTYGNGTALKAIHLYGRKAAGQLADDLLFCELDESEKAALKDWGDRPEGTTVVDAFKLKNASLDKIAHGVNLQLNDVDFLLSFSAEGPWTATLDIPSIAPNSVSAPIYIRHQLAPPNLILGPRQARVIATIASWS